MGSRRVLYTSPIPVRPLPVRFLNILLDYLISYHNIEHWTWSLFYALRNLRLQLATEQRRLPTPPGLFNLCFWSLGPQLVSPIWCLDLDSVVSSKPLWPRPSNPAMSIAQLTGFLGGIDRNSLYSSGLHSSRSVGHHQLRELTAPHSCLVGHNGDRILKFWVFPLLP